MNHDTPSAVALARWLEDHPGTPPPPEVDPEVVQAIYALRPELAPAPRLTADDILASITRGPLAGPSASAEASASSVTGAEVVPFPQRHPAPEPASEAGDEGVSQKGARQGRWLRWIGGPGGIGMALVAAATILLVATPILKSNEPPSAMADGQAPVLAPELAPAARDVASPAASAPPAEVALEEAPVASRRAEVRGGAVDAKVTEPVTVPGGVGDEVITMDGRATVMDQAFIPELQEQIAAGPVAAGEMNEDLAQPTLSEGELDELRAKAVRKTRDNSWRKDVTPEQEQALKEAEALRKAGNPQAAGDKLKPFVQAPARVGMNIAILAAEHYLAASNYDQAVGVAEMGMTLATTKSPERSQLLVLYADGLRRLGSAEEAADAYRQAQ
jgi:hypothetical protein